MFERWPRLLRRPALGLLVLGVGVWGGCAGEYPQTTFRPVTRFGELINELFASVFWWTLLVLVLVEVLLVFIVLRYRAREGSPAPKPVHGHTGLEVAWTLGPAVIVAILAVATVRTVFAVQQPAPEGALEVEVVGHQWWWEFRYPEYGVVTANDLYLPVGRPVHLKLRSADVVHSFWIPQLGGKRDVNPSPAGRDGGTPRYNHLVFEVTEPGEYLGQCAEFCGTSHAIMRLRAVAQEPAEFARWVASMRAGAAEPVDELARRGREVFLRSPCIACHAVEGTPARGALGPSLTRFGARATVGAGVVPNTVENVERWITSPASLKPGVLMPGVREAGGGLPPTGLSAEDVRAVAAYLTSLN